MCSRYSQTTAVNKLAAVKHFSGLSVVTQELRELLSDSVTDDFVKSSICSWATCQNHTKSFNILVPLHAVPTQEQWRRQGGLRGAEAPPKCVKGARVMGVGTLLANVTLLILSIMQFTQFICSHDHTVRCSQ